jgi:hypothetical protein
MTKPFLISIGFEVATCFQLCYFVCVLGLCWEVASRPAFCVFYEAALILFHRSDHFPIHPILDFPMFLLESNTLVSSSIQFELSLILTAKSTE